jgi:hypothetical protein
MPRTARWMVGAVALSVTMAGSALAQATPIACKDVACSLILDWGSGKTSASYPPDKKFGSGDDFEQRFKSAIAARGYRLYDSPMPGALVMTLRPTMRARVMCDAMSGLNNDLTCTAMTNLAVNFTSADPAVKAPGAIRISNRCASGDTFMTHRVFAQYAVDMIWWQLEGQAAKGERPIVNC